MCIVCTLKERSSARARAYSQYLYNKYTGSRYIYSNHPGQYETEQNKIEKSKKYVQKKNYTNEAVNSFLFYNHIISFETQT